MKQSRKFIVALAMVWLLAQSALATPPYGIASSNAWWNASAVNFNDAGTTPAAVGDTIAQVGSQDGNNQSLTQTTSGDRPKLVISNVNGKRAWQFAGHVTTTMGLDIPAGLTSDKQNLTVIVCGRGLVGKSGSNQGAGLVWVGSGGPLLKCTQSTIGLDISGVDFKPTQGSALAENPQVIAYRANGSNVKFYIDGVYSTISALSSGTSTGGCIGNAADSFALSGEIYEVLIAPALSDADLALAIAGMSAAYNVTLPTSQLELGVESNVTGIAGNTADAYGLSALSAALAAGYFPPTIKLVNNGLSGQTIATANTNVAQYTAILNTTTFGTTGNLVAFTGGGNDLNSGDSVATLEANIQAMGRAIRNAGEIPIWVDPPPAGAGSSWSGTVRTNLTTVKTWASTNWPTFASAYVPFPAAMNDPTNTTYWQTDQLHLNAAGRALWGATIAGSSRQVVSGYNTVGFHIGGNGVRF